MILVSDSSALIALARIRRFDLLHQVAGTVHISEAIYDEVVTAGEGRPGSAELSQAQWILRHHVQDQVGVARLRSRLGRGEAEAIVLAGELRADVLILDDAVARRAAEQEGRRVVGILGFLIYAKERGLLAVLKPVLDEMVAIGFFIDDSLYRTILQQAGEEPPGR